MNYFSRKYQGLSYAISFLRTQNKTNIDNKLQTERDMESQKNTKLAQSQATENTLGKIASTTAMVSGPLTLSKSKTLFKALKSKFGSNVDENENENNETLNEEPETTEPTETEIDTADIGDFDEIEARPMTDLELDQFEDPFEISAENVPGNLQFGDTQTTNLPDELDVSELPETGEESMNFIQSGLSNAVFGKPDTKTQFNPEGTQPAGEEQPEVETDDFDVGERLNPDTLEPMGESAESKFETADEVPEDFESVLDLANRTGSFAPQAQIVGGNTSGITGEVTLESVEPISNNTESLSSGGYDLQSFGRSGAEMSGTQFGGDSTIARLDSYEDMSPDNQFAEHSDNISTFGDIGNDVGNVEDVGETIPEGVSEAVEGTTEISEIATEVTEGLTVATDVLDSAALVADSATAAAVPVPGLNIAVATIGGIITAGAIASSIGLGIASAVQNANKTTPITPSDIPVQQQSLAGKYVGISATQNFYGDNQ